MARAREQRQATQFTGSSAEADVDANFTYSPPNPTAGQQVQFNDTAYLTMTPISIVSPEDYGLEQGVDGRLYFATPLSLTVSQPDGLFCSGFESCQTAE